MRFVRGKKGVVCEGLGDLLGSPGARSVRNGRLLFRSRHHGLWMAMLVLGLATGPGAQAATDDPRPIMHEVADALAFLLPLSLDEERFIDPDTASIIKRKLRVLEDSAGKLEAHAGGRDTGFRMLSGSLAQAARRMRRYYDYARPEDARFFLVDLTQNCIACHSRLPGVQAYPLADQLRKQIQAPTLHPRDRAQLQVALRQFEDALTSWEELFSQPHVDPVELDVEGDVIDYLTICIRVVGNLRRARETLQKLKQRGDVATYMAMHIDGWVEDLRRLEAETARAVTLERGRQLFNEANGLSVLPAGRERAVYDLVASGVLHRYIDAQGGASGTELAEAYYMLAIIEARTVERKAAVPQMEFHLEAAIRSDPKSEWAKRSYAVLEEYTLLNFGFLMLGESPDELTRLEALKALMN